MILYDFNYERATSLADASARLKDAADARVLGGGTDLLPNMRVAVTQPPVVVALSGIAAAEPVLQACGSLRIDALSRLATLSRSPLLTEKLPMLVQAAQSVASQQIREMGTLGGNLCQDSRCLYFNQQHDFQFVEPCYKRGGDLCYPFPGNKPGVCWSVYMSDVAPALMALQARLEIVSGDSRREMPIGELFTGDGNRPIGLKAGELISAVIVPEQGCGFGWGYHKSARRGGLEFATSVAAVALRIEDGVCVAARISFGAIREKPVVVEEAGRALVGKALVGSAADEAALARAADVALKEVEPLPHHGHTKRAIADNLKVHLRRILAQAVARAKAT